MADRNSDPESADRQPGDGEQDDALRDEQRTPRTGIPGKGFDAGTGYGGAGNSSLYSGESSYGGQAGHGGSSTEGGYTGGEYGRKGDEEEESG